MDFSCTTLLALLKLAIRFLSQPTMYCISILGSITHCCISTILLCTWTRVAFKFGSLRIPLHVHRPCHDNKWDEVKEEVYRSSGRGSVGTPNRTPTDIDPVLPQKKCLFLTCRKKKFFSSKKKFFSSKKNVFSSAAKRKISFRDLDIGRLVRW